MLKIEKSFYHFEENELIYDGFFLLFHYLETTFSRLNPILQNDSNEICLCTYSENNAPTSFGFECYCNQSSQPNPIFGQTRFAKAKLYYQNAHRIK